MKINLRILVVFMFLGTVACSAYAQEQISPEEAGKFIGQEKTVCGKVVSASYIVISDGKPTFLNLNDAEVFDVVIRGADRAKFEKPPEELYIGKEICVTGTISDENGTPQLIVKDPSQIKTKMGDT